MIQSRFHKWVDIPSALGLFTFFKTVKAQRVVLSGIRAASGAHLVPISTIMLNVKMAQSRKAAFDEEAGGYYQGTSGGDQE